MCSIQRDSPAAMTTREQRRSNLPKDKQEAIAKLDAEMKEVRLAKRALFKGTSYEQEVVLNERRVSRRSKRKAAKKARAAAKLSVTSEVQPIRTKRALHAPSVETKKAFYRSWEWRTLRMEVLKTLGHRCQACGATPNDRTLAGEAVKIVVDHIKPLSKFWHLRLERSNLQVLCDECNMGKGAWDETDHRPVELVGIVTWGDSWDDVDRQSKPN